MCELCVAVEKRWCDKKSLLGYHSNILALSSRQGLLWRRWSLVCRQIADEFGCAGQLANITVRIIIGKDQKRQRTHCRKDRNAAHGVEPDRLRRRSKSKGCREERKKDEEDCRVRQVSSSVHQFISSVTLSRPLVGRPLFFITFHPSRMFSLPTRAARAVKVSSHSTEEDVLVLILLDRRRQALRRSLRHSTRLSVPAVCL